MTAEVQEGDAVHDGLLEQLVDPMLPVRASKNDSPSLSQQQSVANEEDMTDPVGRACNSAPERDLLLVPIKSDTRNFDKIQAIWASKGDEILRASLGLLLKKRNELHHQQCKLEDEIARCEGNLELIRAGGNDDLMCNIESLIEACNASSPIAAIGTPAEPHFGVEERDTLKCVKRKRLSEATLQLKNPCQELDDICSKNNWILPRYTVLPSKGGFQSDVVVQGTDFKCSGGGDIRSNAREARKSAAVHILIKLRSMVNQAR